MQGNPALDSNRHGLTDLDEDRAATDPTNAVSVLRIDHCTVANSATLEFQAISNKACTVPHADRVENGLWSKLAEIVARATHRVETVMDTATTTHRYYRVVTPRQP